MIICDPHKTVTRIRRHLFQWDFLADSHQAMLRRTFAALLVQKRCHDRSLPFPLNPPQVFFP